MTSAPRALAGAILLALPAALSAAPAGGNGHDSNAPVNVSSDRIEVQDQANRAIFIGSVHAIQGNMTMDAARMTVAYSRAPQPGADPQIERIDASGGVTVVEPNRRATGSYGIYDLNRRLITLIGGVTLIQGANHVNGARVVINLDTDRATVDGSAVGGAPGTKSSGGRVTGVFTAPQHSQATQPATAPKK